MLQMSTWNIIVWEVLVSRRMEYVIWVTRWGKVECQFKKSELIETFLTLQKPKISLDKLGDVLQ